MKRILSISLLTIMLSYSFNQIGIFAEYIMDVETFTELYCENTDKPEMECNGKCHLTKQLAENEEQKHDKDIQSPPEVLLFYAKVNIEIKELLPFFFEKKTSFYYNSNLNEGVAQDVLQPPQNFI